MHPVESAFTYVAHEFCLAVLCGVGINIIIERGTLRIQKNDQKLLTYAGFKWSRKLAIFGLVVGKG